MRRSAGGELAADFVRALPRVVRQLGAEPSIEGLWATAPELLCRAGGFDRIGVYLLRTDRVWIQSLYFVEDSAWADRVFRAIRRANLRLSDFPFEARLMARKESGLVKPRPPLPGIYREIVEDLRAREYVSAPITVAGRVAGFVDLDAYFSSRHLAAADVERASALAELVSAAMTQQALARALRRLGAGSALGGGAELAHAERPSGTGRLSDREREVARLVARGLTNPEIAELLGISVTTVKTHLSRSLRKLGARSRAQVAATLR